MASPFREGTELHKGFQGNLRQSIAIQRESACLTFLMTGGLTLATIIAVATVSIEVVKAAALQ